MSFSTSDFKRYLAAMLGGFVLSSVLWCSLLAFQVGAENEAVRWDHEAWTIKKAAADARPSPRLLVLGGSGVHFGVSAEFLEKDLGLPVVNLGIHAGLNLDHLLYQAKMVARPGDTLLMVLEYPYYNYNEDINNILPDFVLSHDIGFLKTMPWAYRLKFVFSIHASRLLRGVLAVFVKPEHSPYGYQSQSISKTFGDETVNVEAGMTDVERNKVKGEYPIAFFLDPPPAQTQSWEKLSEFNSWCGAHGIRLVVGFPAVLKFPYYSQNVIQQSSSWVMENLRRIQIPFLGTPMDFLYDSSFFYDTGYHLHDRARLIRTREISRLLKESLFKPPVPFAH